MLTHTSVHEDFFRGPGASLDLTGQDYSETSQNGREKKMGAGESSAGHRLGLPSLAVY